MTQVRDSCEKIQHFGALKDASGGRDVTDRELCLRNIQTTLVELRAEYAEAERRLKSFYEK